MPVDEGVIERGGVGGALGEPVRLMSRPGTETPARPRRSKAP